MSDPGYRLTVRWCRQATSVRISAASDAEAAAKAHRIMAFFDASDADIVLTRTRGDIKVSFDRGPERLAANIGTWNAGLRRRERSVAGQSADRA